MNYGSKPDPADTPQIALRRIAFGSFVAVSAMCLMAFVSLGMAGITHAETECIDPSQVCVMPIDEVSP